MLIERSVVIFGTFLLSVSMAAQPLAANGFGNDSEKGWTRYVDCARPDGSVQRALDKIKHGRPATIFIRGQCEENVAVEVDDVTLSGNWAGDGSVGGGVTGQITVTGARRVRIEYLHVSGAGDGIRVEDGAAADLVHNRLLNNEDNGIVVVGNAFARVESNTMTGNDQGLAAATGGNIRSTDNHIGDNNIGLSIGNFAYFRNAAPPDVIIEKGCSQGDTAGTCGTDATHALECYKTGICDIRSADVTGNMLVVRDSTLSFRVNAVNGDLLVAEDSSVKTRSTVTGSGFITCRDNSSAYGVVPCGGEFPLP
jgi:parallel beta-helix repeat protein